MHSLILGMTESGKSSVAKQLLANYRAQGVKTIVIDALGIPTQWPNADFYTSNKDEFLTVFWKSRSCAVFIDEAGDLCGQYEKDMVQTATRGRHYGHSCHYIGQRGTLIARTMRDQCSRLFLFTSALEDAKIHANEWNAPELSKAPQLPRGSFYYTDRFGNTELKKYF